MKKGWMNMNHFGTQTLETERLTLRRFTLDDAEAMYKNWASDDEVTKYLMWPTHESAETSLAVLRDWVPEYEKPDYYHWAVVVKAEGPEPIGSIGAVRLDERVESAHIGYCIGRAWWRRGIMSEALGAVIGYLFDEVGMNRVEARHAPQNPNSGRVMQKCGMRYEGTLRAVDHTKQGVCDAVYYGILRSDRPVKQGK